MHKVGDKITKVVLSSHYLLQQNFVIDQRHQVLTHQRQPLRIEDVLQICLFLHCPSMELPRHQSSSHCKLLLGKVVTSPYIFEYPFTDWHWSFYFSFVDLFVVEVKVQDVKVIPSIVGAHHWYSFDIMMGELMAMALDDSVYGSNWQCIKQCSDLIISALTLLLAILVPYSISIVSIAVISHMAHYQHRICTQFPQFCTPFHRNRCILQKLIGRESTIVECASSRRSLYRRKTNHSYLYA